MSTRRDSRLDKVLNWLTTPLDSPKVLAVTEWVAIGVMFLVSIAIPVGIVVWIVSIIR